MIHEIVERQRAYFETRATLDVAFRRAALKKLQAVIKEEEPMILEALHKDLRKTDFEGYVTEVGMVLDELRFVLKHMENWAKRKSVPTPMAQFHAKSFVIPEPYGVALIMSPWNYPFQLCIEPLIGALAAGNCAVIKPSAYAPNTSRAVAAILEKCFDARYVAVIEGGREENKALLDEKFDYIFFTGSVTVGKLVMEAAAKNLTPVSLELGGKSPCIVDATANLKLSARRLAFGKFLNAGQTCVAPDYLLIHRSVKDAFIEHVKEAVAGFYPDGDFGSMPVIVNDKHYARVMGLIAGEKVLLGGNGDPETRWIAPTILDNITWDSPIMQQEIFGPVLPVIVYDSLEDILPRIIERPKPLALYLFTTDKNVENEVLSRVTFGGGCVNDTIIHLATSHMGFGGVGESGMGSYHGKRSFDTFTHYKSIVKKSNWLDLGMRYLPYTKANFRMVRMFMK